MTLYRRQDAATVDGQFTRLLGVAHCGRTRGRVVSIAVRYACARHVVATNTGNAHAGMSATCAQFSG